MKLPKIPIDYSKAGCGEAPFDGKQYLFHSESGFIVHAKYALECDLEIECYFEDKLERIYECDYFTHYTPMPEFEEVKS